ncbi:MAG: CHRD domain-containing protein [Burkholderiaceae bacterium]
MNPFRTIPTLAAAGLFCLAVAAPLAHAGHLNTVLEAQLNGREEVPSDGSRALAGDPDGRAEAYVFGIDSDKTTLCYVLVGVKKIDELTMAPGNGRAAHIHRGARGTNGPVVVNLAWPQDGQAGDCLREDTAGKFTNVTVQEILSNPTGFYVNIHNSVYPSGAIRGQLGYSTSD